MRYFDLHCDTAFKCFNEDLDFYDKRLAVNGNVVNGFSDYSQVFAIWIKDDAGNPYMLYKQILNKFKGEIQECPPNLTAYFSVEGGALIEDKPQRVEEIYNDGIKFLSLTWNGENALAGGADTVAGLKNMGISVIKEMNRLNMGCDLSHLNDKSFYSAIEIAERPLVSHAGCRAIFNHRRNITDDQIELLTQKGGIIGLCFYPLFLGESVFDGLYREIFHLCDKGLEDFIALGSDFDGAEMARELDSAKKIGCLFEFLEEKGFKKVLLDKIFYQNAQNFIAKVMGKR